MANQIVYVGQTRMHISLILSFGSLSPIWLLRDLSPLQRPTKEANGAFKTPCLKPLMQ